MMRVSRYRLMKVVNQTSQPENRNPQHFNEQILRQNYGDIFTRLG